MTRYLEIKPGSISETIKGLSDDYQAVFKAELEKAGKGLAQMTDAEKKAFFNKIDKMHNAKNEQVKKIDELTAVQKKLPPALQKAIKAKEKKESVEVNEEDAYDGTPAEVKKMREKEKADAEKAKSKKEEPMAPADIERMKKLGMKPKKEEVKEEIKVDKPAILKSLQDRLKKLESDPDHGGKQDMIAYVKSKIKMIQSTKEEVEISEQFSSNLIAKAKEIAKKLAGNMTKAYDEIEKIAKGLSKEPEVQKELQMANEEIKLEDKNSGGIDALRAIKGKRLRLQGELERLNKDDPSYKEKAANLRGQIEKQKEIMANKQKEVYGSFDPSIEDALDLSEGQFKDIDIRKGDLKIARDKRQALKDKYNAIMANQAQGDEDSIQDQIRKLDMSIKKQEQDLIDKMKKLKDNEKTEAVDPERVQKLNQKIASMTTKMGELDRSKPENKTKEAIMKSDIATAKLRLQDLMQKSASDVKKAVNEASKAKQSYKSLKMSLKKEQDINNKKKTLTDKPITKIDVNPKIEG